MNTAAETERGATAHEPATRVVALGARRYAVHLCGALAPGWAGSFARELSVRRISVVRGWARRHARRWEAQFLLQVLDAELDVFQIDFLALARTAGDARRVPPRPRLDAYHLDRTEVGLEVAVRAPDGVGLLDALLAAFSFYSLFPHEMTIDTRGGVAHDLFRLQRVGGGAPSDVLAATLEATLRELTEPGSAANADGCA